MGGVEALRVPAKAGRAHTRAINLRLVLQHLFAGRAVSRADLARTTGLTPATVSNLVAELEDGGLIREVGARRGAAQVGKPPTMYALRPDARCVVALDLSDDDEFRAALVDLAGEVKARLVAEGGDGDGQTNLWRVTELTQRALAAATAPVLGVGVGTPGVVNESGVVLEASNLGWHGLALSNELAAETGVPVHVGNDANAAALAEYARGRGARQNLAVIKIGLGVGAGLVLNGQPFLGEHFTAGEIGHLVVDPDGPRCRCGNQGCLETFVAAPAVEAALARGDLPPDEVRRSAGERLGVALASMFSILDLDRIVLAGPAELLGEEFRRAAGSGVRHGALRSERAAGVAFTSLGGDIVLHGAAGLVVSKELGVA